jgi:hypothetical protein
MRDMKIKRTGWKKKPCPFSPDKLHYWSTFEEKDKVGNHIKVTACKYCMMMP